MHSSTPFLTWMDRIPTDKLYSWLGVFGSKNLAEWWSAVTAAGLGATLLLLGDQRLTLGLLQGPVVEAFAPMAFWSSLALFLAGLIGLYGVWKKVRLLRMLSSLIQFAGLGWLSVYYYYAIPVPWQGVWVYAMHSVLEAGIFIRVQHSLDTDWH